MDILLLNRVLFASLKNPTRYVQYESENPYSQSQWKDFPKNFNGEL